MSLSVLILAAGLGSRFGGDKQLEAVGPNGEAFFDYSIRDALRSGFDRAVIVTRSDIEEMTRAHLAHTQPADADIVFVRQDDLGPARDKPWGTGHAVLSAADAIDGPFAMVNADDYYGREAFAVLAELLQRPADMGVPQWSMVTYPLAQTLSPTGSVTRGICGLDAGRLVDIVETSGIARGDDDTIRDAEGHELADDTPVSMNFWGFTPALFDVLRTGFAEFEAAHRGEPKAEYLIPDVVGVLQRDGAVDVLAAESTSRWLGVTHRSDLEPARAAFTELHAAGIY